METYWVRRRLLSAEKINLHGDVPQIQVITKESHEQALAEKDREIDELKKWQSIVIGTGTDQEAVIRMAAAEYTQVAVAAWRQAYHALMEQAVKMAEALVSFTFSNTPNGRIPRDFLASPKVRAWRAQEGGHEK